MTDAPNLAGRVHARAMQQPIPAFPDIPVSHRNPHTYHQYNSSCAWCRPDQEYARLALVEAVIAAVDAERAADLPAELQETIAREMYAERYDVTPGEDRVTTPAPLAAEIAADLAAGGDRAARWQPETEGDALILAADNPHAIGLVTEPRLALRTAESLTEIISNATFDWAHAWAPVGGVDGGPRPDIGDRVLILGCTGRLHEAEVGIVTGHVKDAVQVAWEPRPRSLCAATRWAILPPEVPGPAAGPVVAVVERAERDLEEEVRNREQAEEIADRLAYSIAPRDVIGEHSSGSDPWLNALELAPEGGWKAALEQARSEVPAAPPVTVPAGILEAAVEAYATCPDGPVTTHPDGLEAALHAVLTAAFAALPDKPAHRALALIARGACENDTSGPGACWKWRDPNAKYGAERWCHPCTAHAALTPDAAHRLWQVTSGIEQDPDPKPDGAAARATGGEQA